MNREQRDFCLKLRQYILSNKAKVWMDYFTKDLGDEVERQSLLECSSPNSEQIDLLACDSVGCIAGTACLMGGRLTYSYDKACELIGVSGGEAYSLFYFPWKDGESDYDEPRNMIRGKQPGTTEYVEAIARAIDIAIERNFVED